MDRISSLEEQLVMVMFRFRKMGTKFPADLDSQIGKVDLTIFELTYLKSISDNKFDSNDNI